MELNLPDKDVVESLPRAESSTGSTQKDERAFLYDIFFSYNEKDLQRVSEVIAMYNAAGIRTFFAYQNLLQHVGRPDWEDRIFEALESSHHLGVYCSKDALLSSWVQREVEHFERHVNSRKVRDSLILVIPDPDLTSADLDKIIKVNPILDGRLRPRDHIQAFQLIVARRMGMLCDSLESVQEELVQTRKLAREAFEYYRQARFWMPFLQEHRLHVFTCGRDMTEDKKRGSGGRTNIDKWDYQTAVDITHHFAWHQRRIRVQIEQPVSKARIDEQTRSFDTTEFTSKLADRNCVIIGSPHVSDFAEITLAKLLNVDPYAPGTLLRSGFKIIKNGEHFSTFYELPSKTSSEGVRLISPAGDHSYVSTPDRAHGVLVLADNPFSQPPLKNKILILVGQTGVATRAMSLLLTNEDSWCLDEFYEFDQTLAVTPGAIAAVIEVQFSHLDRAGDDRVIHESPGQIRFMNAVSL